ncbi:hypothetical protein GCM10007382_15540 [Salinibacterium xinjiangense]|uniref:Lipoprotein n=1 Tax=Salinibacterium xinjiangense TaxID=386302 RepID=A0A2C8YAE7_9MICO|nr:hypothetical protein [Salinibacterium xinjiangense]GGK96150.1 hypothetical protein GCM10007382_15540 [Salinibacterium xinjiangense]SOE47204.1 hypothetical protein SAMN06296378_0202 [Salinibacterium xinjiangense]
MRSRTPLFVAPLLLLLAGCTAAPAPTPTPLPEESNVSAPTPDETPLAKAPGEVEADTTLIVKTTATAANGAQLALEMRVHQPIPFDDVANQTLPGAFVESCGATYNADLFAAEAWSFARANISAVPTAASTADWPTDATLKVEPTPGGVPVVVPVVGRGMLREAADATAPCSDAKSFSTMGNGAIALGVKGDSGTFRGWTSQRFGFTAAASVTFSDCSFVLTDLGTKFGGGDDAWSSVSDGGSCTIGGGS